MATSACSAAARARRAAAQSATTAAAAEPSAARCSSSAAASSCPAASLDLARADAAANPPPSSPSRSPEVSRILRRPAECERSVARRPPPVSGRRTRLPAVAATLSKRSMSSSRVGMPDFMLAEDDSRESAIASTRLSPGAESRRSRSSSANGLPESSACWREKAAAARRCVPHIRCTSWCFIPSASLKTPTCSPRPPSTFARASLSDLMACAEAVAERSCCCCSSAACRSRRAFRSFSAAALAASRSCRALSTSPR
mmetsp:Transcript_4914/g.11914  ORF Transcript_4914/g.11914 Transcript_4914/m.11914 type:complete len:257 (-) Transcript_4914:1068-1838(-)